MRTDASSTSSTKVCAQPREDRSRAFGSNSPAEAELYRRESIDLAQLPDRTEVVEALLALYHELLEEGGGEGRSQ